MITLCRNLFYKPKYANAADSMILNRLCSTVAIIVLCLAAISLSAYAYFSYSVTSGINTIQASSFSTTITITGSDGAITQGNIQTHSFQPGQYTITIARDSSANGTGYCIIRAENATYYTQQLGKDLNAPEQERTEISFVLDIKSTVTISFESHWGTTAYYHSENTEAPYIKDLDPLMVVTINGTPSISEGTQLETVPEETTPPTESTEPTEFAHIVADGESLYTIASQYGLSYQQLAAYNQLENPRLIQPGQKIFIPPLDWEAPTE